MRRTTCSSIPSLKEKKVTSKNLTQGLKTKKLKILTQIKILILILIYELRSSPTTNVKLVVYMYNINN